ncbi:MAG: AzlD domain-containing protein [Dactylosporangium sp.]|nr:AzlD domain-containing protein [Dactylosporangium sp.]NNJ61141.1 AzlD domain-containing protein [Dactylosporangium sp.]
MTWAAVLLLAAGTYALRLAGPMLRRRITLPEAAVRYCGLGAVVLLAAFIATSTMIDGTRLVGPTRPAAVAVGAILALRRAPFIVVVCGAAVTAAVLRLAGLP